MQLGYCSSPTAERSGTNSNDGWREVDGFRKTLKVSYVYLPFSYFSHFSVICLEMGTSVRSLYLSFAFDAIWDYLAANDLNNSHILDKHVIWSNFIILFQYVLNFLISHIFLFLFPHLALLIKLSLPPFHLWFGSFMLLWVTCDFCKYYH